MQAEKTEESRTKYIVTTFTFVILVLQFTFAYPLGSPLTIGAVASAFILFTFRRITDIGKITLLFTAGYAYLALQLFYLEVSAEDSKEYIKTLILISYNALLWLAIAFTPPEKCSEHADWALKTAKWALVIIAIGCNLQHLSYSIAGYEGLFGVLGPFSYKGVAHPAFTSGKVRAYFTYLEPSYCAQVVVTLYVALAIQKRPNLPTTAVFILALVAISSASGLIAGIVVLSYIYYTNYLQARRLAVATCCVAACLSVCAYLYNIGPTINEGNFIAKRISEIAVPETSSYYRIIAPLQITVDTLSDSPLGMGLGQVENAARKYGLTQAGSETLSIDNTLHLIVFYFGWAGIAIIVGLVGCIIMCKDGHLRLFWIYTLLILNFGGGGIFNAEFGLLYCITILAYKRRKHHTQS